MWTTSRGHTLTDAEARFTACDALVTPIVVDSGHCPDDGADLLAAAVGAGPRTGSGDLGFGGAGRDNARLMVGSGIGSATRRSGRWSARAVAWAPGSGGTPTASARIAALASTLLGTRIPLAVGRTARTATPAQRRALAARDRGCIIPGCAIPAEACQTHHVQDWAAGGATDLPNMALLCWAHHRQVDLGMWTIVPTVPADQVPRPEPGAPPGTPWPGNNGAPWTITRTPRTRWRL